MIDPDQLGKALPKLIQTSGWADNQPEQPVAPLPPAIQQDWEHLLDEPAQRFRPRQPLVISLLGTSGLVAAILTFALLRPPSIQIPEPEPSQPLLEPAPKQPPSSGKPKPIPAPPPTAVQPKLKQPARPPSGEPKPAPTRGTMPIPPPPPEPSTPTVLDQYLGDLCQALREQTAVLPEPVPFVVLVVPLQNLDEPVIEQADETEGIALAEAALATLRAVPVPTDTLPATSVRITIFSQPGLVQCDELGTEGPTRP